MYVIIADSKMPEQAKLSLEKLGKVIWFESENLVYNAISGHPDIFLTQIENYLVVAPNTPKNILKELDNCNISFCLGEKSLGIKYPKTAFYNALVTNNYIIHNINITDNVLKEKTIDKRPIHVKQGYGRCNCVSLNEKVFVTSDIGIYKTLVDNKLESVYINPNEIILNDFDHGFFGGTCGIFNENIVFCGSLSNIVGGEELRGIINKVGFNIVELYAGPLYDVGSIFFVHQNSAI